MITKPIVKGSVTENTLVTRVTARGVDYIAKKLGLIISKEVVNPLKSDANTTYTFTVAVEGEANAKKLKFTETQPAEGCTAQNFNEDVTVLAA